MTVSNFLNVETSYDQNCNCTTGHCVPKKCPKLPAFVPRRCELIVSIILFLIISFDDRYDSFESLALVKRYNFCGVSISIIYVSTLSTCWTELHNGQLRL